MVCSITVIKQTVLWNSSRKIIDACSRKVLEQTIRIFLELFLPHSKYPLEKNSGILIECYLARMKAS